MRLQFGRYPALVGYVEHILQSAFATRLPPAPPVTAAAWGPRAEPGNGSTSWQRCAPLACSVRLQQPAGPALIACTTRL